MGLRGFGTLAHEVLPLGVDERGEDCESFPFLLLEMLLLDCVGLLQEEARGDEVVLADVGVCWLLLLLVQLPLFFILFHHSDDGVLQIVHLHLQLAFDFHFFRLLDFLLIIRALSF